MSTDVKNHLHLASAAGELRAAERQRVPVVPLTKSYPDLSAEQAHWIQRHNIEARLAEGERLVGYKLGLTSPGTQKQFGVFAPDYGQLTDAMSVWEDSEVPIGELIQPKIEGEIALVLGRDLQGPGVTVVDALRAVDFATAAVEIVDCRVREWRVTHKDLVSDNGAAARYVLSPVMKSIRDLDLAALGMAFSQNGEVRVTGSGAATLGHPIHALVFLANQLGRNGTTLREGMVVLTGALAAMLNVSAGDRFVCEIQQLGRVSVRFGAREETK